MHPHFSRNVRQYHMPIFEFHPKHRVGQSFCHSALYFNDIFFGHVRLFSFPTSDRLGRSIWSLAQYSSRATRLYGNGMFKMG